ncbi:MAG: hypothetical protein ABIR56_11265 [Polaromonas sp.]
MLTDPQALLGHHSKRSRVVWHPGSTPPYSSLWITVQRFLMLNQPTRCAFAQDFLVHPNANARISLDPHGPAGAVCPVRLRRFARALGEPLETFRHACVAQFARAVWPFFGGFAACPDCLREGFHSVLFSFDGLDCCPVHGVKLGSRICCGTMSNTLVLHDNATPPSTCGCGAALMAFAVARSPKPCPERDRALREVADWLMHTGSRCWLGPQSPPVSTVSLARFTQRVAQLKIALDLPGAIPRWAAASDASPWDPSTVAIMTFGSAKMREPGLQGDGSPWLEGRPSSPYAYQQTALGDFKAISRYLRHHVLKGAHRWIARFVQANDTRAVQVLITAGGEDARWAWALLIWWQTCFWDLKLENWLTFRPFRWVSVPGVPELVGQPSSRKTFLPDANPAQEWITRWINAIALLDFWRHTAQAAALDSAPRLAMIGKGILGTRALPDWSLGIDQDDRLVLCVERLDKPCWRLAARQSKSERQAASRAGAAHRLEQLHSACAPPCLWFHGDTTEWSSGAGPMPDGLRDGKRHRLLAGTPKRWFAIFPWLQAPCAGRAFVARCLSMPLAATGPSPCHAVRNLKYAVKRYENLQQADAAVGA